MYNKLIILKNVEIDKDEELLAKFRDFNGEITLLNNFTTNICDMYTDSKLADIFNFEFLKNTTYLQINTNIIVNKSLIRKLNTNSNINYKSNAINIMRIGYDKKQQIDKSDYSFYENIKLEIIPIKLF